MNANGFESGGDSQRQHLILTADRSRTRFSSPLASISFEMEARGLAARMLAPGFRASLRTHAAKPPHQSNGVLISTRLHFI